MKRTCHLVDFAVLADHWEKMKGSEIIKIIRLDLNILKEVMKEYLAMEWIDRRKSDDIPITVSNTIFQISKWVVNFITKTMENWRMELTAGGLCLAEVKIQRGFFHRNSLFSLQFVIAMISLNYILQKLDRRIRIQKWSKKFHNLMVILGPKSKTTKRMSMYLHNPFATDRVWQKVNFQWSKAGLDSDFPSPRLVV